MNYEDVRIGQTVTINDNLSRTVESFGVTREMKALKGKTLTVTKKENSISGPLIKLDDHFKYSWHPEDLTPVSESEKPEQIFHYNVEELLL